MNLTELLKKRSKNEELTEEEKAFLSEYDKNIAEHLAEIERLKTEKETVEVKLGTFENELKTKEELLKEKEETLSKVTAEKEDITKALDNAKSIEEAKKDLEKAKAEKEKMEAVRLAEEEKAKLLEQERLAREEQQEELRKMKEQIEIMNFEKEVINEKSKRPYLEKQLTKVLSDLKTKTLAESKTYYSVLINLFNHDEEMAKWRAQQTASSNVFTTPNVNFVDKEEAVEVKSDVDRAKELGFRVRK